MASPFLRYVADYIFDRHKDNTEKLCIVLPGKRAATFLKSHLAQAYGRAIWLPKIITAEELVAELSGLSAIEEIDLICQLYESYADVYGAGSEEFDSFVKWGSLILQDFNEIDRYLADPKQLYENLKDIKVIENWSLAKDELTEHQQNYLRFMSSLGAIYAHFTQKLLSQKKAYQGLMYRKALENVLEQALVKSVDTFLFCGFNALNEAELSLCKTLKSARKAEFLWDADHYYLDDSDQEAGHFLRANFKYLNELEPQRVRNYFAEEKSIDVVSVPKQIGQAQVVRQKLQELLQAGVTMDRVALVLANEKLLWPVLQFLPEQIEHVNITMEYPLRYTSSYHLVEQLINLQYGYFKQQRSSKNIYFADLIKLLRNPLFAELIQSNLPDIDCSEVIATIRRKNLSFIGKKQLAELFTDQNHELIDLLFEQNSKSTTILIDAVLKKLAVLLENKGNLAQARLELEYLNVLQKNINRLQSILSTYNYFDSIANYRQLFQQIVGSASAPFIGEPMRGLQVMGVLETRTLDFDHVIMVNVNEGILPSGKTSSSFIPNDLKRAFGLPLYTDKDAVYAYHFYRLLQRASDILLICDSETDSFGKGEPSRFVTQLTLEFKLLGNIRIREYVANFAEMPKQHLQSISIEKTEEVLAPLMVKGTTAQRSGLSPSALNTFKQCGLRFYYRYSAGLQEPEKLEESAESNTFGSILHACLDKLYRPYLKKQFNTQDFKSIRKLVASTVTEAFAQKFGNRIDTGKLALQQEVIKVYIDKLLDLDASIVRELQEKHASMSLLEIEAELVATIDVNINGKAHLFYIKGTADRIDLLDDSIRIVDYKNSVHQSDAFTYKGFNALMEDVNYNKQFQLILYAWLYYKSHPEAIERLSPCIIPFKNFGSTKYIKSESDKQNLKFTKEFFDEFEHRLSVFIESIYSTEHPFSQTQDEDQHTYCPYNVICGFAEKN